MKKKFSRSLVIMALMISPLLFSNGLHAQTDGTLTCVYTTTFTGGGWGTKNLLAAWIETSSGTFIKTKFKYASGEYDHLATWVNKSGSNVVDAITGPTRSGNGTMTLVWNGTNVSAALVSDGPYKVWIEMAWGSSLTTGKTVQSFSFTKGATADHQTGNTTNFTGVTLDWVPSAVGIADNQEKENFTITPNPITSQSTINYSLTDFSDVTISLYDVTGKLVNVLFDANQNAGNYNLPLSVKAKAGIYFIKMYTGKTQKTVKILIP